MRRVLLFEYLHVHSQCYAAASVSMRNEGRAMLLAIAADLAALDDVAVTVAVCETARHDLPSLSTVEFICVGDIDGMDEVGAGRIIRSVLSHGPFSDVLPIAPEIDDVLATLVRDFRAQGQHVIAACEATIQLGSDKWQLFQFLQQHQIPTIPTTLVQDHVAADVSTMSVIKPIDGAGGEGVRRMTHVELDTFKTQSPFDRNVIVQPFITGQSYSVGLLGRGVHQPPLILPVATQHVAWIDDRPQYRGGSVPAELSPDSEFRLRTLLTQLLNLITVDCGYVGIDLLKPAEIRDGDWLIVELNPRLCTSYIGYRAATKSKLAPYLLGICGNALPEWKTVPVVFSCESSTIASYNS